jgi:hypothetical protein
MKVLNIAADDWANLMHVHANALRSVGVDCTDIKLRPHAFSYDTESQVVTSPEMVAAIRKADIVNIYHSSRTICNLIQATGLRGKFTVWHTGSDYRREPYAFTKMFKDIGVRSFFTDQCEFLLIDQTLKYVATAIDVQKMREYQLNKPISEPYKLAHYPSKADVKGSEDIINMVSEFGKDFRFSYSDEKVSHSEQLKRMADCDVYIELFKPTLEGKPYGCFGVTAFEAAALWCVVITQNINTKAYADVYGDCPMIIANTKESFVDALEMIRSYTPEELQKHKEDTQKWIWGKHSYESTGNRIKKLLEAV